MVAKLKTGFFNSKGKAATIAIFSTGTLHKAPPHLPVQPLVGLFWELVVFWQQLFVSLVAAISLLQEFFLLELVPQANTDAGIKKRPIKRISIMEFFFIYIVLKAKVTKPYLFNLKSVLI